MIVCERVTKILGAFNWPLRRQECGLLGAPRAGRRNSRSFCPYIFLYIFLSPVLLMRWWCRGVLVLGQLGHGFNPPYFSGTRGYGGSSTGSSVVGS